MSHRTSFLSGALLIGVNLFWAVSAPEALAAPIRKGDLVVTTSDGTQVKSEDDVLMTLPADTAMVAADVQGEFVLVRVRKDGKEITGFVQTVSLRRVAMVKHTDPQGFSLQYPEWWKVASAEHRAEVARKGKEYTEKLPGPAPSPASCIISNSKPGKFGENVNCVVGPGSLGEVNDGLAKQYAGIVRGGLEKVGLPPANIRAEVMSVGNKKAVSARWDVTFKWLNEPVGQWQVVVPGKSQLYTLTCSALASDFWRFEPLFAAVIQSVEVDVAGAKPWGVQLGSLSLWESAGMRAAGHVGRSEEPSP